MPVQQSGSITPGHLVKWVTEQVVGDAGANIVAQQVLGHINANFGDTNDQPIALPSTIQVFAIAGIIICNASTSLSAAVGGFYPQASKGGTPIVAASQVYSALTDSTKLLNATLASYGSTTRFTVANVPDWAVYLSLTTGQGVTCTADVYIIGTDLTVRS